MKKENRRLLFELGYASCLGIAMAIAIFGSMFIGLWLDAKFNTGSTFILIFLVLGILAAFRNVQVFVRRYVKDEIGLSGKGDGSKKDTKNISSKED